MMQAEERRGQTTKGIWISKSPKIDGPTTLVMDLEGSDSRERGEDDTNFERQSALFALAVADTLIINLWNSDIGREHGSGKPLLKTIMQVGAREGGRGWGVGQQGAGRPGAGAQESACTPCLHHAPQRRQRYCRLPAADRANALRRST
jgi:hypothetical protein